MTDSTSDDSRDDFILQERLSGRSERSLSRELRCSIAEIHSSLDRTLPTIDNPARLRHISLDPSRLDGNVPQARDRERGHSGRPLRREDP